MISNDQLSRWLEEGAPRHNCFALFFLFCFYHSCALHMAINRCLLCFAFKGRYSTTPQFPDQLLSSWDWHLLLCLSRRDSLLAGCCLLGNKGKSGNMKNYDALDVFRSFCLIRTFVFMVMMLERRSVARLAAWLAWMWLRVRKPPSPLCSILAFWLSDCDDHIQDDMNFLGMFSWKLLPHGWLCPWNETCALNI